MCGWVDVYRGGICLVDVRGFEEVLVVKHGCLHGRVRCVVYRILMLYYVAFDVSIIFAPRI